MAKTSHLYQFYMFRVWTQLVWVACFGCSEVKNAKYLSCSDIKHFKSNKYSSMTFWLIKRSYFYELKEAEETGKVFLSVAFLMFLGISNYTKHSNTSVVCIAFKSLCAHMRLAFLSRLHTVTLHNKRGRDYTAVWKRIKEDRREMKQNNTFIHLSSHNWLVEKRPFTSEPPDQRANLFKATLS